MADGRSDQLSGALEMLVLRTLTIEPAHGYAIARHIERLSQDVLKVEQGSLYPALDRLLRRGLVTAKWGDTPTRRKARYYTITAAGRKRLEERSAEHERVAVAIRRVMRAT
jgi:PadR family transcriptional regulator, regulatory protein PadR